MAYIRSQGCYLAKENTSTSPISWDTIGQVTDISGPDGSTSQVEVTHLLSTGKEYVAGLADFGQFQFTVQWDHATTSTQHAALYDDFVAGTTDNYRLYFSDSPQTILAATGFPSGYSLSLGVDQPVQANISIKISGAPTIS